MEDVTFMIKQFIHKHKENPNLVILPEGRMIFNTPNPIFRYAEFEEGKPYEDNMQKPKIITLNIKVCKYITEPIVLKEI